MSARLRRCRASELADLIGAHVGVFGRYAVEDYAQKSRKLTRVLRDDKGKIVGTLSEQSKPDGAA